METLFNGYAFKAALIQPLDTDLMLADYVFRNVHLHTLLLSQQEHACKIVGGDFMEML